MARAKKIGRVHSGRVAIMLRQWKGTAISGVKRLLIFQCVTVARPQERNLNIQINGAFKNFENFAELNGLLLDGVHISVVNGFDVYQPRNPKASAYYRCVEDHFEKLETVWDDRYQSRFGFWRPYVTDVIRRYLASGS
jgi:hypothetical protein